VYHFKLFKLHIDTKQEVERKLLFYILFEVYFTITIKLGQATYEKTYSSTMRIDFCTCRGF